MRKILEDIQKMPYYRNYQAVSGKVHNVANHEKAVEDILVKHGLSETKKKISKEERNKWMSDSSICDLPNDCYVFQPCGKNDSPDFIVKKDNKVYFLECKTTSATAAAKPVYNSGVPKAEYIYIYSSGKYNQTTFFFGEHILSREAYSLMMKIIEEHRNLDEKYNVEIIGLPGNPYNIGHYTRPMMNHRGRGINYFTSPNRKKFEQEVLDSCM